MSKETCQRCGDFDYDRRTLWHKCFYEMNELNLPFERDDAGFYKLRVCKECRAEWLGAIKTWFETKPVRESCGSGIFVREKGATVEISHEEWNRRNPDRTPVKWKPAPDTAEGDL